MGFFDASKQPQSTSDVIPPEIVARISVMSDHMATVDMSASKNLALKEPLSIPVGAIEVPHGPFSAEDPGLMSAPTTSVQPVPQESVESSPFLQTLTPESLLVSQKVKPQVDPPMFLTEKNQVPQFGLAQTLGLSQTPMSNATQKSEKKGGGILFQDTTRPLKQKSWWALGFFLAILLAALGGVYYYFYVYSVQPDDSSDDRVAQAISAVVMPDDERPAFEFSLVSPNYLSVNVETVSIAELRSQLEGIGTKMKSAHISTPIEFFVTDQTNTPIAFSRFIVLIGLRLPENVVSMTDESFSLFLYDDQGRIRVGLRVSLKGDTAALETLKKAEVGFPVIFQDLFLESKMVPQKKYVFKESLHDGVKIRYVNIAETEALSIDYALDGNSWFLGTSKNVLRAVLDAQRK
ncbi:MAG: hypothetical protein KA054_00790 [Candidatus Moranbacteria bacterium]|nr:hypothetical protein [Candidatus Moranbacteria bacterium]